MAGEAHPTYSLVIPVYNEAESLPGLLAAMTDLMGRMDGPCEVILVNDGSSDSSYEQMLEIRGKDERFKIIQFSRNFGHQIAVTAGLDAASGDAVVIMDADLQDPPEVVVEMAKRWREGFEVVYGVREEREGETWFKRATAAAFYRLLRRLSSTNIPRDVGDFRLVDRKVVEAVGSMPERSRFLRGMFSWVGFRQTGVKFRRAERKLGTTKYPLSKMMKLAMDGVLSFSNFPLRLVLFVGTLVAGTAFLYGLVAVILRLSGVYMVSGWTSIIVVVTFLGGVQLMVLGVVGEYLARMYDEVRRRPLYIVSRIHGFSQARKRE